MFAFLLVSASSFPQPLAHPLQVPRSTKSLAKTTPRRDSENRRRRRRHHERKTATVSQEATDLASLLHSTPFHHHAQTSGPKGRERERERESCVLHYCFTVPSASQALKTRCTRCFSSKLLVNQYICMCVYIVGGGGE